VHHGDFDGEDADGVAVGRRVGDGLMADHALPARAIDHRHRLAEIPLQERGDDPRHRIGTTARAPGDDQADGTLGIRSEGRRDCGKGARGRAQRRAKQAFHGGILPYDCFEAVRFNRLKWTLGEAGRLVNAGLPPRAAPLWRRGGQ
jgi:hypothetical protein